MRDACVHAVILTSADPNTKRESGKRAQVGNIEAAKVCIIAEIICVAVSCYVFEKPRPFLIVLLSIASPV